MRLWSLLSVRNPIWRVSGGLMMAGILGITTFYVGHGPTPLKPSSGTPFTASGTQGRFGTVTEPLGKGLFVLSYETISGKEKDLRLQGVSGQLDEPLTSWRLLSPEAHKRESAWTLMGPLQMEARKPGQDLIMGQGSIPATGPALGWEAGVWHGLSPLVWNDLQGGGRGRWDLPAGWYRGLDGRFVVEKGPVHWTAAEKGALRSMEAASMWSDLGFQDGHLEQVSGHLEGGDVQAQVVEIEPQWIRWSAPITFQRQDGWRGEASHGQAPRPPGGKSFDRVEFQNFHAQRSVEDGLENLQADGARWTPAGLRLEGSVKWEQPLEEKAQDGKRLLLRAPRVLQRVAPAAPGDDLPPDLAVDATWAEPQAVLTWGPRSLSSPRIEGRKKQRQWKILAPALGRSEMGTFRAGEGHGKPSRWEFDGPVQADLTDGAHIRGDKLLWENTVWTLTGRPVTWTRIRQRLAGSKLIRRDDGVYFPNGISGALAAQDGDITLRADQGVALKALVNLEGRVECQGSGWRLQAERISVTLGPGSIVKQVKADGTVVLRGRMGEGRGDALDMDPEQKTVNWRGRVKAGAEVAP